MQAKKDMPKRYQLNRPDLAQAVAEELRTCQDVKSQQRLLAARLAASGQLTAAQIAEQLGISRRRFFDWMNALKAGGLAGLLERQHGGGAVPQVQGAARKRNCWPDYNPAGGSGPRRFNTGCASGMRSA